MQPQQTPTVIAPRQVAIALSWPIIGAVELPLVNAKGDSEAVPVMEDLSKSSAMALASIDLRIAG